jgi:Fe(3+) dicitrate transport protein
MTKSAYVFLFLLPLTFAINVNAQIVDSIKNFNLNEIEIKEYVIDNNISRLPSIQDNIIYAGKKSEVVLVTKINADLSVNNARQLFAKVPGIHVWENDGSGIQTSISSRGLSPNRSWEFNTRQNGSDMSSDPFGYPEAYYAPPSEALEKIEVVRGAASLQYGPQFGGLLNYKIKEGNKEKAFTFETQQTVGSYGLFNSYNAIGGTKKKFSYYGFLHFRQAEGWRKNSDYLTWTGYLSASYQLSDKASIRASYTKMNYKSQQAGGLTDAQYQADHQQSLRGRNWMSTPWNLWSVDFSYAIHPALQLSVKGFMTIAQRNSVGYTKSITVADSINPVSNQFNPRQVDKDSYENYGIETRMSYKYSLNQKQHTLAAGFRIFKGNTSRNQLGIGTTASDFDLDVENNFFERSLYYTTTNYAFFAENIFQLTKRLKIVPGIRYELINNSVIGYLNSSSSGQLQNDARDRSIVLYGVGSELQLTDHTQFYGNYSLAYRPVTFSELTPSATTDVIDPNLKDASGFNADLGYRGKVKNYLVFDVGAFYLNYDNRIGTIIQNGFNLKTNIGASVSKGIESFVELDVVKLLTDKSRYGTISIFSSNSFIDARYVKWDNPSIANDPLKSIENKRVENVPAYIHRFGLTYHYENISATCQMNKVASVYTDAANTELANANATVGKLNGYQVVDFSISIKINKTYNFKASVNNIFDEKYATRRSGGYPGPGILPGNARTFSVSFGGMF